MTDLSLADRLADLGVCDSVVAWAAKYPDAATAWAECQRGNWLLWITARCAKAEPWSDGRKPIVACALECALLAKRYWPESSRRQIGAAVATMQRWTRSEVSTAEAMAAQEYLWACDAAAEDDDEYVSAVTAVAAAARVAAREYGYEDSTAAVSATAAATAAAYAAADEAAAYAAAEDDDYDAGYDADGEYAADIVADGEAYDADIVAYGDYDAEGNYSTAAAAAAAVFEARKKTLAECADIVRRHFPTPPELPE